MSLGPRVNHNVDLCETQQREETMTVTIQMTDLLPGGRQ